MEADSSRQPVNGQNVAADQLGQRPADDAEQQLELEGAILAVAEAEGKPGVVIVIGLDVRDAPAVATDLDTGIQSDESSRAAGRRQAPAEKEAE